MKKFWQKVIAFCLCITVSVSAMVAPVAAVAVETIIAGLSVITAAAGAVRSLAECTSSVAEMVSALKEYQDPSAPMDSSMWIASSYWGGPDAHRTELPSKDILWCISQDWNNNYAEDVGFSTTVCERELFDGRTFWVIRCVGVGRGRGEPNLDYYLCDGNARILCVDTTVTPPVYNGTWNAIQTLKSPYCLVSYAELSNTAVSAGGKVQKSGNLYFILNSSGTQYYATPSGLAYAYMPVDESASGSDRPTDSVVEVGGDGSENTVTVDGDNTKIDIENGTFTGLDGTLQIIDGVIYDESTKTYYIDSHDSYNTYNYYTYQYYINYTSITYIGTTEEYDKHYEVYYTLPDGRSSADLTAEELEQLNLSIDVINYGRSADDVSLRSLYHFDGDTDDESYWNYCTDFTWNKGASLTYMDEGTFNGSLYLDETEHDFTFTMPSGLTGDFTLQFRYYQSATAAPQTDSYIKLGTATVMQFDGSSIKNGSGAALSVMPIGSWNELALIRDSGTLYYYLNGVKIGSVSQGIAWQDLNFHFGSSQQTFKKLDELRILNTALQKGGASYTPTSVPHDTNLTLVLPDSAKPVADEYWSVKFHADAACSANFSNGGTLADIGSPAANNMTASVFPSGLYIQPNIPDNRIGSEDFQLVVSKGFYAGALQETAHFRFYLQDGGTRYRHQFSIIYDDGTVFDVRFFVRSSYAGNFAVASADAPTLSDTWSCLIPGGVLTVGAPNAMDGNIALYVVFDPSSTHNIVAIERYSEAVPYSDSMVEDSLAALAARSTITAEHITSITPMTPEDLATPTLAVRSDIPVTTWQIGGVRPSVPTKGQVWALVERQYITSLQIYNGRAWESCDGRIWTGSRWVPYSSYNVVTLKDMSDIMDSSGTDHEYIYTESGFWDWLQRWLNEFKLGLFGRLDKLKGSGTDAGSASSSAIPDVPSGSGSYDFSDGSGEDVTLPEAAKDSAGGLWAFVKGVWKLVGGAFKNAGKAVSDLTDAADTANPDGAFGFFLIPLEEEGG